MPVVIPSYQPDEKLVELADELENAGISPVVIVDDGSEGEAYRSIFERLQKYPSFVVLHHEMNMGKGRALKTAFSFCLNEYPEMMGCVTADSDGQHTVHDICLCMDALVRNPDALILGVRDFSGKDIPKRSSFGNHCTSTVMKLLTGVSTSDTQTGLRGIPAAFMKKLLTEKGDRYEFETNMLIDTKEYDIRIAEVPISTIYISGNTSSHFHVIRDSVRIYAVFMKFIISSGSSSLIDIFLFWLFSTLLLKKGSLGRSYIMMATVMARVISSVYNFIINYRVVFKSGKKKHEAVARYFILAACIMVISGALVTLLCSITSGNRVIIKIIVDCVLFLVSFVVQREFVY